MKETLKQYLIANSKGGIWTGSTEHGVPIVRSSGKIQSAIPFLDQLGIKLKKSNKYNIVEEITDVDYAGMGTTQSGGDTSDTRDGISQEQE